MDMTASICQLHYRPCWLGLRAARNSFFPVFRIGPLQGEDVTRDLLDLLWREDQLPADHPFRRNTHLDRGVDLPDATTVDPVLVGEVCSFSGWSLLSMAGSGRLA